jgi:hypothetical protein
MSIVESKYTVMRIKLIPIVGVLSFLFSLAVLSITDKTLAQNSFLTDSEAPKYYSNPNGYVISLVDFKGKVLTFPESDIGGVYVLQMYQGGDRDRNTIVVYTSPIQLLKDDCVRVVGTAQQDTLYKNMFGATRTAATIHADSVTKIDCYEDNNPAKNVVMVEKIQKYGGITVTLHKVEFSDKNTRVYLTLGNSDPSKDVTFYDSNAKAVQGHTQFQTIYSFEPTYPKIESTIPPGISDNGVVLFEPLDKSQCGAKFIFHAQKGDDDIKFTFDVAFLSASCAISESMKDADKALAINSTDKALAINSTDINTLISKGYALSGLNKPDEALRYYDKALAINSTDMRALKSKGGDLLRLGNYTEAIGVSDKILEIRPNDTYALNLKALAQKNEK